MRDDKIYSLNHMEHTAVIDKETLDVLHVTLTQDLNMEYVSMETQQLVTLPLELTEVFCGVDTLSARMNNGEIEVFKDPTKYKTSRAMDMIREERNTLLQMTDWTLLPDNTLDEATKQSFIEFRKQLRDVTDSNVYPCSITLPEHPMVKPPWKV